MELLLESIKMDWAVLLPIFICSILVLGVVISKWSFYSKNQRDITVFMRELNKNLSANDLSSAQNTAIRCGGVIGEVIEEAVRIFSEQKKGFSRSFDISAELATRKLESNLTILGTIGGVAPFLGLFGTVVRILLTFGDMAKAGQMAQATDVMSGIGSALIATAFGLGVAIVAVIFFNSFQSIVKHYEDDFQLIKLLFLSFVDGETEPKTTYSSSSKINL
jgi:biopolymer transport protein ExbB